MTTLCDNQYHQDNPGELKIPPCCLGTVSSQVIVMWPQDTKHWGTFYLCPVCTRRVCEKLDDIGVGYEVVSAS